MDTRKDNIIIYHDIQRDGDMKKSIDELRKTESSLYFERRSGSEIARLVLIPALQKEIKRLQNKR